MKRYSLSISSLFFLIVISLFVGMSPAHAQLVECDLVNQNGNINAPGGCIAKSLQDQIGAGQGTITTPGSSQYLIARDPARSVRRGRQLFQRKFSLAEGHGPRVNTTSSGDITQSRAFGAGNSDSCASCHGRPRGSAGFGGDVNTFPDSRDAPHLFGLGLVEQLADEMTADLRAIQAQAIANAKRGGDDKSHNGVRVRLRSKGVNFGYLRVFSDGSIDTSEVEGVNDDLRVKPFFHDGRTISMREFIVGAFNDEMGLQVFDPVLCAATGPGATVQTSPSGFVFDPSADTFERPKTCSASADADGDGVTNEIDGALLDHMEFYLLNYFKPGQYRVSGRAQIGRYLMGAIGCTSCHVPDLVINNDRRVADVETDYDPVNGIFNDLFARASLRIGDPIDDGQAYPILPPARQSFVVRNFFSDLKRHDLGVNFHERDWDGSRVTEFVTEPLWGVGSTSPYGHDGRSINLDQVIRRHGGEARNSRNRYTRLSRDNQAKIQEFLQTLVLFAPDDTASDLNPGNPNSNDPQNPANHGSINLGALFQILDGSEGPE